MKNILGLMAVFVALVTGGRAEAPSIRFDGETYQLAWVDVSKNGAVTNEYVRAGETIEAWTMLVAVRHWPEAKKIFDAAGPWITRVGPSLVKKMESYIPDHAKSKEDIIFEAWLGDANRAYIEPNLFRFVVEAGVPGVKAYQFAEKIVMTGGKGDPTTFMKRRNGRFGELAKMEVATHLMMVAGAAPVPVAAEAAPVINSLRGDELTVEAAIDGAGKTADGLAGSFVMEVRGSGRSGAGVYLNSEVDYRSRTCLTVVVPLKVAYYVEAALGSDFRDKLVGKRVRVVGVARRVPIRTTEIDGKPGSYFQAQIELESADRLQVVGP